MAGRTLTEEEKAARAAARAAEKQKKAEAEVKETEKKEAQEATEKPTGRKDTELEELKAMIRMQAEQIETLKKELSNPPVATLESTSEVVTVMFIAEVSDKNTLELPGYGSMRPGSYLEIPKMEFGGKFMSTLARKLIDKRHLIVVSGLNEDERIRWNCDYKEGEVLSEKAFDKMLDYDMERLTEMFTRLCPEHQRFVARRFITAKENGDNRVSLDKAKALNEISKKNDPEGMLKPVITAFKEEI